MSEFAKAFSRRAKRGSVLSDASGMSHIKTHISTGCLPLDIIMGGYGLPIGRLVEMYGNTSSGKTLIALQAAAQCQKMGGIAVMLDSEVTTDETIASAVGVDLDSLVYDTPGTIEEVYALIQAAVDTKIDMKTEAPMLIIWDSVAATAAQEEIDSIAAKGLNSRTMGVHARLMSALCRNLPVVAGRNQITLLFINQVREKIGIMFGDPETTPGGRALPFFSSLRIKLTLAGTIKHANQSVGINVKAQITKSKVCPPYGTCKMPIYFGEGTNNAEAVLEWVKENAIGDYIGGRWSKMTLTTGEEIKWQGAEWAATYAKYKDTIDAMCLECDYVRAGDEDADTDN